MLHEVDVPILKNDECQDMFHKSNHLKAIRDSFICAGYTEGFKDSCEGDSGKFILEIDRMSQNISY
jgi:secreted trypsin-like serine protease